MSVSRQPTAFLTRTPWLLLIIAAAGFIVYLDSLPGAFLWDDAYFITNNVFLRDWRHLPDIFTSDVAAGSGMRYNYYRPLTVFTYLLDYSVSGLDPRGYHLSNILFHLLTAVSVFFLARRLFFDRLLAFVAGLLFALHPLATETVAYISGRPDSLVALFMILAFLLYLRQENGPRLMPQLRGGYADDLPERVVGRFCEAALFPPAHRAGLHPRVTEALRPRPGLAVLMTTCYLLAALSRENCIVLPPLILWYHLVYRKRLRPARFLPFLAIALGYVILRMLLLDPARVPNTLAQRLPGFFAACLAYLSLYLFPIHLHQEYGLVLFSWFDPRVLAGMILIVTVLILALRSYQRGRRFCRSETPLPPEGNRSPAALFCVGWFFIALLPVSGIYPIKAYLAEHWLYVPSLGVFSLAGLAFSSLAARPGGRRPAFTALVCLVVLFGALTARQNLYFRDPQTFYERTVRYNPSSARLLNNLGIIYYDQKRVEEARALFERAVALDPEYPEGYNNLGHIYYQEGKFPEAVALFRKAIRINPRSADAFNNLGVVACEQGNYQEGARFFAKAAECNPFDPSTRYNLGLALARLGKGREAEAALLEALKINPAMGNVHERLARLYAEEGDYRKAAFHAERAAALGCPTDRETQEKIRQKSEGRSHK